MAKATIVKTECEDAKSQQVCFKQGAKPRATGVYSEVNEDCEMAKATMFKTHLRRL